MPGAFAEEPIWPYEQQPNRGLNQRSTVMSGGAGAFAPEAGLPGGPSGPQVGGPRAPDGMWGQGAAPDPAGMEGTQSGRVDESTGMNIARIAQYLAGLGLTIGGVAGGAIAGGSVAGLPGALTLGPLGGIGGMVVSDNATSPNPQDVWAHQYVQRLRRNARGVGR